MKQPTLETRRIILRPFETSDAADVQRLAGHRAIADTTLEIPHPYQDGTAEQWISAHPAKFQAGEAVVFAVMLRESTRLAGAVGLELAPRFDRAELGYWIAKEDWGKGYATEAGLAVLSYGFTTLGLHRIYATPFKRNPASGRVLEKLGMKHEGRVREHVKKWGVFEDLELYGILCAEWQGRNSS
jgi:RimJ/RimL family protein N-acetyltransferase